MVNYKKELIVRSIKILDIGYITIIYVMLGIILAKLCDKKLGDFDEKEADKKSIYQHIFELILLLWLIGVIIYIVRNLVPLIPFPLDGLYGFNHLKMKELTSATFFTISFMYFQVYYQNKIKYVFSKIDI
jgi:hypothetical protein